MNYFIDRESSIHPTEEGMDFIVTKTSLALAHKIISKQNQIIKQLGEALSHSNLIGLERNEVHKIMDAQSAYQAWKDSQ